MNTQQVNWHNMKRIFNLILTIPEEKINMSYFRTINHRSNECDSAGCVIGWSTQLDKPENIPRNFDGGINFTKWSEEFTGIKIYHDFWTWCFDANWPNNKMQILIRIKYLIDNYSIPIDWVRTSFGYYLYELEEEQLTPYEF